jgi:hypothetical protein
MTITKRIAFCLLICAPRTAVPAEAIGDFDTVVKPFFATHCLRCHGPETSKGTITLHTLKGTDLVDGDDLEHWETILDMLSSGEMPPEDEPQPLDADREAVAAWIDAGLRAYVQMANREAPATTARRLTNFEYQNTMRDLLGIDAGFASRLPADPGKAYRFNNSAEFMLLGPEQYDTYLEIARRAMAAAIVDPGPPKVARMSKTFAPTEQLVGGRADDEVDVYTERNVGIIKVDDWPQAGEFRIRVEAAAILPPGHESVTMRVIMGSLLRHDAGAGDTYPVGTVEVANDADHFQTYEFRGRMENHPLQVGLVSANGQEPSTRHVYVQNLYDNGELNHHRSAGFDMSYGVDLPRIVIRSVEMDAPVADVWPPEHHTRILFHSPLRETDRDAYVREVLERFLARAFRRPATDDELNRFMRLYAVLAPEFETLEAAMRETLAMVLVSPQFLYHAGAAGGHAAAGSAPRTANAYDLASKLSYFLWGSMPDDELFRLAADGTLAQPTVIESQVRRMLADRRSKDFVRNFTKQWLSIDKMHAVKINLKLFPDFLYTVHIGERAGQDVLFRPTIRDDLEAETVGFVAELIKRNASILDIVDSDFAVLNERLAAHYGVEGVKGMAMRPVPLSAKDRDRLGGLLTQASILVANGTGSAPHTIYRAVWLREAILGDDVKPPPAEVPALVDSAGDDAANAVTIKDLLALHRKKESCNDCHARLDPWGVPFEQYNAIGRFQPKVPARGTTSVPPFQEGKFKDRADYAAHLETINTVTVDATSVVPHGPEIDGIPALKSYLLDARREDIVENMVRRLVTYAIGRTLTYRDRFEVEELVRRAESVDNRFQDVIVAICTSPLFVTNVNPR